MSDEHRSDYHIFLPGVSRVPVGGYKVLYAYANELAGQGHEVTVWHSTSFFRETATRPSVQGARAIAHWALNRSAPRVGWYPLDARVRTVNTPGLPRPHLTPNSVVVASAVQTFSHASMVARNAGATSVGFIQHYEDWSASDDYIAQAWAKPDLRIVIAPWLAERTAALGLSSFLLPNAVDPRDFPLGDALDSREPRVLSQLSSHDFKRPDLLKALYRRLHSARPEAKLAAFGQEARPSDLADYVEYFRAPEPRVLQGLYRSALVYVCTSDAEGWHLPPAEATLAGAAVVSTDIGGVRASLENDAVYVPAGDLGGLVQGVTSMLRAPGAAQPQVDSARARLVGRTVAGTAAELHANVVAFQRQRRG